MTRTVTETSRDYAHPRRPATIRTFNRLAAPAARRGKPSLEVDGLIDAAISAADGWSDFGAPDVVEPLTRLVDSIESEAALHPFGRVATRARLVGTLRSRLRHAAHVAANPEIREINVAAPIVITGLQRTGTTFLHRLLAADPRLRALISWEALSPGPPMRGKDRRQLEANASEKILKHMAPDFFAVHPVESMSPEEEVLLLDQTFISTASEATLHVPSFAAWVEGVDQAPAYAHLREQLQSLWHQRPAAAPETDAARWVLKTPHHLEWLDTLLDEFPDARIIQTHRDPVTTVASFCSMIAHGRGIMSDVVDPHEVGRHWLRKTSRMVERAMDTRARRDTGQFLDVAYEDTIADPISVVRQVWDHVGLTPDPGVEAAIRTRRDEQRQHRYGRHVYDLADFALTEADIADAFTTYRASRGWA